MGLMTDRFITNDSNLTDLFYTQAFSGSWKVFEKFNWLGGLMQFIISAFCLIGIFLTAYQLILTLLYLSSRTTFDRIHELKQAGKGGKALGLPNLFKDNIASANNGTGLDAIVSFGLSLLPDVKAYSDYGEERRSYNLQDDDTVTTYILKKALPTIMIIFFFSIGFNGTLFRAYGMVVDAMATVASDVVETDLNGLVRKWMNSGSAYKFAYDADNTEYGKFRQNLAEQMYSKVLAKTDDLSTNAKLYIGQKIEEYINNNISISEGSNMVGSAEISGFNGTDADCKNLQISVVINGTQLPHKGQYVDINDADAYRFQQGTNTVVVTDEAGNVTTKTFVIDRNTHYVYTFADLKEAFNAGGTAKIMADIQVTEMLVLKDSKELVLDMNGHKLTINDTTDPMMDIKKGTKLTITGNGTFDLEDHKYASLMYPRGEVIIENGNFLRATGTNKSEYGSFFVGISGSGGAAKIRIYDGYFDGGYYVEGDEFNNSRTMLNASWGQDVKVYGGTFVGQNPAYGDEGMAYTNPNSTSTYCQAIFFEGQTRLDTEIPSTYTVEKGTLADGRPTYKVIYTPSN